MFKMQKILDIFSGKKIWADPYGRDYNNYLNLLREYIDLSQVEGNFNLFYKYGYLYLDLVHMFGQQYSKQYAIYDKKLARKLYHPFVLTHLSKYI